MAHVDRVLSYERDVESRWEKMERRLNDELALEPVDAGRSASVPPALPVLAERVSAGSATERSTSYRTRLVDHAGDSFFMAATSLLRQDSLSKRRSERLQAWLASRRQLLDALRDALAKAGELPAGEQAPFLARLAESQSPALLALETEEEAIRLELTTRTTFQAYEDGSKLPIVRAATLSPPTTIMYFTAQFEPGLSATQRELLQGMAQDVEPPSAKAPASLSFWPAQIRLSHPAELSPELASRLERLQQMKANLLRELAQLLNRLQSTTAPAARAQAFADLAAQQAPAVESLNALADELRPLLAEFCQPAPAPAADLPPQLRQQLARAYTCKAALQHDVDLELRELRRLLPHHKIALVRNGQVPAITATPTPDAPKLSRAETDALRERLKRTNAELESHTAILNQESQALLKPLRDYRDQTLRTQERDLTKLTLSLGETVAAHDNEPLYRDYRAAVLQAGLSLEQRRLLLRGALVDIERARLRDPWVN